MKKCMAKSALAALAAGSLIMGVGIAAKAEAQQDVKKDAQAEEASGTGARQQETYLFGEWYAGEDEKWIFTPDGQIYRKQISEYEPYCQYTMEDDMLVIDWETLPEEELEGLADVEITGRLVDVTKERLKESGGKFDEESYYAEAGRDQMLEITLSAADITDPLSAESVSSIRYFCKARETQEYLLLWMKNKSWELEGKVLTMKETEHSNELAVTVDNGAQSGSLFIGYSANGEPLRFNWGDNHIINYVYIASDAEGVTLQKEGDSDEAVVVLKTMDAGTEQETRDGAKEALDE